MSVDVHRRPGPRNELLDVQSWLKSLFQQRLEAFTGSEAQFQSQGDTFLFIILTN